jgi:hypothetical protein
VQDESRGDCIEYVMVDEGLGPMGFWSGTSRNVILGLGDILSRLDKLDCHFCSGSWECFADQCSVHSIPQRSLSERATMIECSRSSMEYSLPGQCERWRPVDAFISFTILIGEHTATMHARPIQLCNTMCCLIWGPWEIAWMQRELMQIVSTS